MSSSLQQAQRAMGRYLRNPLRETAPEGIEPRRLAIYRELVYNNIEGFISSGFPVLRSLHDDAHWHTLVQTFIAKHRCHTPYFLQISQEFLRFLMESYEPDPRDFPFLQELAHYEWLELYLDTLEQDLPPAVAHGCVLTDPLLVSPLMVAAAYHFPVHEIGPGNVVQTPSAQPNYLLVYRKRSDEVCFMKANQATVRLLDILAQNAPQTGAQVLDLIAKELGIDERASTAFGRDLLERLLAEDVVLFTQ